MTQTILTAIYKKLNHHDVSVIRLNETNLLLLKREKFIHVSLVKEINFRSGRVVRVRHYIKTVFVRDEDTNQWKPHEKRNFTEDYDMMRYYLVSSLEYGFVEVDLSSSTLKYIMKKVSNHLGSDY